MPLALVVVVAVAPELFFKRHHDAAQPRLTDVLHAVPVEIDPHEIANDSGALALRRRGDRDPTSTGRRHRTVRVSHLCREIEGPAVVGVPVIAPVAESRVSPGGRLSLTVYV